MKTTDLTIVQGSPFRLRVRVQRRNEAGVLVPMPLPGCLIEFQARPNPASETLIVNLSSATGDIEVDEVNGTFLIYLSSKKTSEITRRGVYQCELTPPGEDSFRILSGLLEVDREVVR